MRHEAQSESKIGLGLSGWVRIDRHVVSPLQYSHLRIRIDTLNNSTLSPWDSQAESISHQKFAKKLRGNGAGRPLLSPSLVTVPANKFT
eukprot:411549-Amorphochlora_amoeboformis.AAC.1